MGRLLCWLGLHRWGPCVLKFEIRQRNFIDGMDIHAAIGQKCSRPRCGRTR